jgi:myo-inositol-1(or 4)-monophosphatase
MSPRLAFAIEAAMIAGRSTLEHFQTGVSVEEKADGSPVTIADREAETILRAGIETVFPGEAILGEEFGGNSGGTGWILDPIDGTKSFICGVPLYATLVSYEVDFQPQVAVAYFPALDEIVYAELGGGCFLNDSQVTVSSTTNLAQAAICCGGQTFLRKNGKLDGILKLADGCRSIRTWCDAYGHCLVATGRAEAMIDPVVARWDISSVRLLVSEAGGKATGFSGTSQPVGELVSSNGLLHNAVLEAFRN